MFTNNLKESGAWKVYYATHHLFTTLLIKYVKTQTKHDINAKRGKARVTHKAGIKACWESIFNLLRLLATVHWEFSPSFNSHGRMAYLFLVLFSGCEAVMNESLSESPRPRF